MSILDDIKSFEYISNLKHQFGIKSGIVWGNSKHSNSCYPILYISKPKNISQEDYEILLNSLRIEFVKGTGQVFVIDKFNLQATSINADGECELVGDIVKSHVEKNNEFLR
jgi:hypothetical protein